MRANFPVKVKKDAHKRARGICECHLIPNVFEKPCGLPLEEYRIRYEHIEPDMISKRNDLDNCAVLREECWRFKTDKYDAPVTAKVRRFDRKRQCIQPAKRSWGYGRDDKFKMKIGGGLVNRHTGEPAGRRRT